MTILQAQPNNITIDLFGRNYTIRCPKDKEAILYRAADLLRAEVEKARHGIKHPSMEQVTIVAALNLAAMVMERPAPEEANPHHQETLEAAQAIVDSLATQCAQALQTDEQDHDTFS